MSCPFFSAAATQFRRGRLIKVNSSEYEGTTWLCDSASLKSTKNKFTQPQVSPVVTTHVRVMQYPSDNVQQQPLSCCRIKDGPETRLVALFFVNSPTDLRGRPPGSIVTLEGKSPFSLPLSCNQTKSLFLRLPPSLPRAIKTTGKVEPNRMIRGD